MPDHSPSILQIIPQLDTGGAELSAIEMSEAVTRAGGRMLVASEGGRQEDKLRCAGGELIRFRAATKNPARIFANARALVQLIRTENITLLHARSRAPAWSALMAARQTGIPFVTTYHGAYSEKGRLKNWYNSVMARGDMVIANSRYIADLIAARYGTDAARVRVIYRGVDVVGFDRANISTERLAKLREAWGLSGDELVIMQAARMTKWKGHKFTIGALAQLLERDNGTDSTAPERQSDGAATLAKAVVILAGDAQGRNAYIEELQAQIDQVKLGDKVRIVGHCADMPAAFALSHVAIMGSDGHTPEAFGRAAAEAQAAGCPVIAADFGAPPETVRSSPKHGKDERTGWLVAPGSPGAVAQALDEALLMPADERACMGKRARANIIAHFTDEMMKRQTLAVYDQLLGTRLLEKFMVQNQGAKPSTGVDPSGLKA